RPRHSRSLWLAAVFSMSTLLAACGDSDNDGVIGGGGGNGPGTDVPSAGQQTLNRGAIRGFSSIIVNGVYYDDEDDATITIDNATASPADLRLGMVVDVIGPIDNNGSTGAADALPVNSALTGPVSEVNATANSFTVLGTSVLTNEATIFDGLESLADLNEDDRLVIHGFSDNEGNLFATRVERDDSTTPSNEVRVTGTVTNRSDTSFQV